MYVCHRESADTPLFGQLTNFITTHFQATQLPISSYIDFSKPRAPTPQNASVRHADTAAVASFYFSVHDSHLTLALSP